MHHYNACSPLIHFDLSEELDYGNYMTSFALIVTASTEARDQLLANIAVGLMFVVVVAKFFQMVFRKKPKSKE